MWPSLIKGSVMGGLAMFLWGMVSWTVLPWRDNSFLRLTDESAVSTVLAQNAPRRGVYVLPHAVLKDGKGDGPRAFIAYDERVPQSMARPMGGGFLINILGALCLTWLLIRVRLPYGGRVLAAGAAGVFAGVVADLPDWNWWGFSTPYTIVSFVDHVLGGLIAGLVIAWVIDDRPLGRPRP